MNPANIPLGLYIPGTSLLHRASPRFKLVLTLAIVITSSLRPGSTPAGELRSALALVALCFSGFVLAKIPLRVVARQLLMPAPFILVLGLFLWWRHDALAAGITTASLYAAIMAAVLLTLTTSTAQLMDAMESFLRPFERVGLPRQIVDTSVLAVTLVIRLIPRTVMNIHEVLEARKARGVTWSIKAFGVPLIVKTLLMAVHLGEALISRGR